MYVYSTGKVGDRRHLVFHLNRQLVTEARWQSGDRFMVSIGVGDDVGAFQICPVSKGKNGIKLCRVVGASAFRLRLCLPPEVHGVAVTDILDGLGDKNDLTCQIKDGAVFALTDRAIAKRARLSVVA